MNLSGIHRCQCIGNTFQLPGIGKLDAVQYCNFLGFVVLLGLQFRTCDPDAGDKYGDCVAGL